MESCSNENNCVRTALEKIADAQRKVDIGARESSLHGLIDESTRQKKNTIPFILYCESKPFIAYGI